MRQTLEAALKTKTPSKRLQDHRTEFVSEFLDVLTKMYGLTKQIETVVGNAFIRGVSGGERKRLSIAEQMAVRSSVNMWDGSTRGLDASSALGKKLYLAWPVSECSQILLANWLSPFLNYLRLHQECPRPDQPVEEGFHRHYLPGCKCFHV